MGGTAKPEGTDSAGNVWLDGLLWGDQWTSGGTPTEVSVYVAGQSGTELVRDGLGSFVMATTPYARETAAMGEAMAALEARSATSTSAWSAPRRRRTSSGPW
jgi:hypothetical protein